MEPVDNNSYYKMSRREVIFLFIFFVVIGLFGIYASLGEFAKGQSFSSLLHIVLLISVVLFFLILFYLFLKKTRKTVSSRIKSIQENDINTSFSISSDVGNNMQTEEGK